MHQLGRSFFEVMPITIFAFCIQKMSANVHSINIVEDHKSFFLASQWNFPHPSVFANIPRRLIK